MNSIHATKLIHVVIPDRGFYYGEEWEQKGLSSAAAATLQGLLQDELIKMFDLSYDVIVELGDEEFIGTPTKQDKARVQLAIDQCLASEAFFGKMLVVADELEDVRVA